MCKTITSIMITIALIMICSPMTMKAMDPATAMAGASMVKGGIDAIIKICDVFDHIGGSWFHNWWACQYEDGLVVYNSFKAKRDFNNVFAYFTGQSSGDCDSFYQINFVRYRVCYQPFQAQQMVQIHGRIVDIRREMPASPPPDPAGQKSDDNGRL